MNIQLLRNEPIYSDLINNFKKFHQYNSEEDLLSLKGKWEDDTDYSNYRTLENLLENVTSEDFDRSHVVSVDIKDIFSSEESLGGCDRPLWSIADKSAIRKQYDNLNRTNSYRQGAAQVLSGMLRPHPTISGRWQLVKFIGNNRVAMKLLANCGESTRVLMSVSFHKPGKTQSEYIQIESELHATDAGDRSGQNEGQKFISGYRARRDHEVYTFNFLKKNECNYGTIMQQEGIEDSEHWLTVSSLQGIKSGRGNGHFKRYGEENVSQALQTIKSLCRITGEKVVGATPIESIALMYRVYTECGKVNENSQPLFTRTELHDYFVKYFEHKNSSNGMFHKDKLSVSDLSWSGGVKDIAYICAKEFWPTINEYWMSIRDAKIGLSVDCFANQQFLRYCTDRNLRKEIVKAIA